MSFYFIYDLPNWTLGMLVVSVFLVVSLVGLFVTRPLVSRLLGGSGRHNDVVSVFFGGIGVFYGLALGLIAVGMPRLTSWKMRSCRSSPSSSVKRSPTARS